MPKNAKGLVDLVSLKQQITNLNHMMKLETLHPDRRQLAQYTVMWLGAKDEPTKVFIEQVILALVGRRIRASDAPSTKEDRDYDDQLQSNWEMALRGKSTDASKQE